MSERIRHALGASRVVTVEHGPCADGQTVAQVVLGGHRVIYTTPPGPAGACVQLARQWIGQQGGTLVEQGRLL
jgi:hypothetical protein